MAKRVKSLRATDKMARTKKVMVTPLTASGDAYPDTAILSGITSVRFFRDASIQKDAEVESEHVSSHDHEVYSRGRINTSFATTGSGELKYRLDRSR